MYTRLVDMCLILASFCAIIGAPPAHADEVPGGDPAVKCGTPEALRAYMARKIVATAELDPDLARLVEIFSRSEYIPDSMTSHISPSGRFKVHYASEGYHSPDPTDADMNGVPDYVDSTGVYLDYAWALEIETLGYPEPKSDAGVGGEEVDVYLKEFGSGGYGLTYPEQTHNGSSASYMVIDNDFSESQYATFGYDALRVTTAHEFFHVIHYTMITDMGLLWWMEQSAVWMEERAWNDVNDYIAYLHLFFMDNTTSLDSSFGYFMYGAGVWPCYLSKRHGEDIIRDTWLNMAQSGTHTVGAMDDVIPGGLAEAFHEFAVWNYFTGDRANVHDFHSDADLFNREVIFDAVAKISPGDDAFSTNHLTSRYVDIRFVGDWGADDAVDISIDTNPWEAFLGSLILYDSPSDYRIIRIDGDFSHISLGRTWTSAALVLSCTETSGTGFPISFSAAVSPGTFAAMDTPGAFKLDAPYPNPFNPATTIAFTLAEPGHATVRIYNAAGQQVTKLLDERLSAGEKRLMWKPGNLAAGQYIVAIDTPAGRETAKLLYCK
jgi:hypothetical protein